MPENLENHLLKEIRKLKQKNRKRIIRRIGVLLLLVGIVSGFIYLFFQDNYIWNLGNSAISGTVLLLIFLVLIVVGFLFIYLTKDRVYLVRYNFPVFSEKISRLKRIPPKYLLGYTLLLIALIDVINPSLILNQINGLVNFIVYKPTPPTLSSPWPWKDNTKIHPVVANIPSNIETTIQSVAKYIYQHESDPYLRIKAIHDYVISRVTYDLEVLKTGIRPDQDAQTVFSTHKAVCEGYANLFMALGRAMGADVVYVRGKIRRDLAPIDLIPKVFRLLYSDYDWTNHAWNAVKILDNWQLVDTTWDDGDSSEFADSYSADYLILPPEVMSISHFPQQLDWQLLPHREDYNTFEQKPILSPQFFTEELKLISPTEYRTKVQKVAAIKIGSSPNYHKKIVALFTKAQKTESSLWDLPLSLNLLEDNQDTQAKLQNFKKCQSQPNAGGETEIFCQFLEPGDYEVLVFSLGQKVSFLGQLKFNAQPR
ncbi:transglutaminase domain-containing protein [Nostoc sp. C117]|uniref:transglutaminase domain-containing protein n=1 Tax=Nostoc sp. C117 TaxID=3349875 RepID=UPI00370DD002